MQSQPKVGTTAERSFVVETAHAIRFGADGPEVLSTPWLVWFMEHAALDAALACLDPGEITVGTRIEVDHLAPTPVGAKVACTARIVHSEGPVISYQLEANDGQETVARGFHKRRVVRAERLASRVRAKRPQ